MSQAQTFCGRHILERFAFILDLKSGQFQLLGIMSKVLTSMIYIPVRVLYTVWRGLLFVTK